MNYKEKLDETIKYLDKKKKVLLIVTSNRRKENKRYPKSSILAKYILKELGDKAVLIDVTKLKIYDCEGNISQREYNDCGEKGALLNDSFKNPSKCHRCWASLNNLDDELWKISKELLEGDAVLFLGSVRWGQMNAVYQRLIERLSWLENMHSTLGEKNVIKNIDAGLVCTGHNWNGENVVKLQRKVLEYFGFKTPKKLFWNWQYTKNYNDESQKSYKAAWPKFLKDFQIPEELYTNTN